MKVTAIEPSGNLYGSEQCLLDIIDGTSDAFDWDVVTPPGGGFDEVLNTRGVTTSTILLPSSHTRARLSKAAGYLSLRRHLIKRRPDVLYVNQAGMLRAVDVLARGTGAEVVCQVQTLEDARFIASQPRLHSRVRAFICNSRFIASAAKIPAAKLCVFYQPVMPVNMPRRPAPPPPRERWRVAILGRIAESKGHYVFLESAARLVAAGRNDFQFVVIGAGITPEATADFVGALNEAGMSQHFEMRGFRPRAHEELEKVHIVVIPSLTEPLGRVLLDAAAVGRPAIVSDSGGLGEMSRHFGIGRRTAPGNAAEIADAISAVTKSYDDELMSFKQASENMFRRLDHTSYLAAVRTVIENAASGRSSSIEWLGDPN